jgi:hypothetical protein
MVIGSRRFSLRLDRRALVTITASRDSTYNLTGMATDVYYRNARPLEFAGLEFHRRSRVYKEA